MIHLVWHLENPAMSAIWNCTNRENNVANYLKKPFDIGRQFAFSSIQFWSSDYTYIVRSIVLKSLFIGLVYKHDFITWSSMKLFSKQWMNLI